MQIKYIIVLLSVLSYMQLHSQSSIDSAFSEIEKNNLYLKSLRAKTEADKKGLRTGITPDNPEFEIGYLWGSPGLGNRTDIGISQSFDFPTTYLHNKKSALISGELLEISYDIERQKLKYKCYSLFTDIVYNKLLQKQYVELEKLYAQLEQAYADNFDNGGVSILEMNKIKLELLQVKNKVQTLHIRQQYLIREINNLNGGNELAIVDSSYNLFELPAGFDTWFNSVKSNIPEIKYATKYEELAGKQVALERAESLPGFTVGYLSEQSSDESFRGLVAGVEIPLWENVHKVKTAKLEQIAVQEEGVEIGSTILNNLEQDYIKAQQYNNLLTEYKNVLNESRNELFLKNAFSAGHISLTDYLYELRVSFENTLDVLELEYEYNKALCSLYRYN